MGESKKKELKVEDLSKAKKTKSKSIIKTQKEGKKVTKADGGKITTTTTEITSKFTKTSQKMSKLDAAKLLLEKERKLKELRLENDRELAIKKKELKEEKLKLMRLKEKKARILANRNKLFAELYGSQHATSKDDQHIDANSKHEIEGLTSNDRMKMVREGFSEEGVDGNMMKLSNKKVPTDLMKSNDNVAVSTITLAIVHPANSAVGLKNIPENGVVMGPAKQITQTNPRKQKTKTTKVNKLKANKEGKKKEEKKMGMVQE